MSRYDPRRRPEYSGRLFWLEFQIRPDYTYPDLSGRTFMFFAVNRNK